MEQKYRKSTYDLGVGHTGETCSPLLPLPMHQILVSRWDTCVCFGPFPFYRFLVTPRLKPACCVLSFCQPLTNHFEVFVSLLLLYYTADLNIMMGSLRLLGDVTL